MDDNHRKAIKKELRVVIKYFLLADSWLDTNYPSMALSAVRESAAVIMSVEAALESAASQATIDFRAGNKTGKSKKKVSQDD